MNKLLIWGFSILMGVSVAGMVWYFWGLAENVQVALHNLKVPKPPSAETDENAGNTDNEG